MRHADSTIGINATPRTTSLLARCFRNLSIGHPVPVRTIVRRMRSVSRPFRILAMVGALAMVIAMAGCESLQPTGSAFSWSRVDGAAMPHGTGAEFLGVSCVSIRNCFAVGSANPGGNPGVAPGSLMVRTGDVPLIEHFDGASWSTWPTPTTDGALFGVSCPSASFCVAVGFRTGNGANSLIEHFDGKSWQLDSSPNGQSLAYNTNRLWSVSCTSSVSCAAVGSDLDDQSVNRFEIERPVIDTFSGRTWSMVPLSPLIQLDLLGVSCKKTSCLAVGSGSARPNGPQAEFLSGGNWTRTSSPPDVFGAVSCSAPRNCFVSPLGGEAINRTMVHQFNGRWTVPSAQLPRRPFWLNGISCVALGRCIVVGNSLPAGASSSQHMVIGMLQPRSAALVSLTNQIMGADTTLTAVSCVSADECVAVGMARTLDASDPGQSRAIAVVER